MLKCTRFAVSVYFLVSFVLSSSNLQASENNKIHHDLKIKVIRDSLWNKGLVGKDDVKNIDQSSKKKRVLYFPEELELALKILAD